MTSNGFAKGGSMGKEVHRRTNRIGPTLNSPGLKHRPGNSQQTSRFTKRACLLADTNSYNDVVLASISSVCRLSHRLMGLPHVRHRLMDFMVDVNAPEHAKKAGLPHVVRLLLKRCDSPAPPLDVCRYFRFLRGVTEAVIQGNIKLLDVWLAYYPNSGCAVVKRVYETAITKGNVHLLVWLQRQKKLVCERTGVVAGSSPVIQAWQ